HSQRATRWATCCPSIMLPGDAGMEGRADVKQLVGGRYEIKRKLGAGGMATVYLAHDPLIGRDVAIKLPRADEDADAETLGRFRDELRAVGRLNHPNIVTVYDGGEEHGEPFLVMEPVDGESLAQRLRREGSLPVEEAVRIGGQVAEALAYAHDQGTLHRDIKPQNILLDRQGRVKVTDFGIAKSSGDATRTLAGTLMGTPAFMAPEVSAGDPVSPASDVYSLGVVLFLMLTGHTPFESENPIATAIRSQREDPVAPSKLSPIPAWLDEVTLRALARDPAQRYRRAEELAADLVQRAAPAGAPGATEQRTMRDREQAVPEWEPTARLRVPSKTAAGAAAPPDHPHHLGRWLAGLAGIVLLAGLGFLGASYLSHVPPQPRSTPSPVASPSPSPAGRNLIANAGLVPAGGAQPAGWRPQTFEGGTPFHFWRPGGPAGAAGDHEMGIKTSAPTDTAWVGQAITLAPGTKVTLSGYVKTTRVPLEGPGAALHLVCHASNSGETGQVATQPVKGNGGWTHVSATFTVPAGSASCEPQLRLGQSKRTTIGTAEFSQVSLVAG
ncbi:MAG: protein kinase domain-containing protein, partial [Chloroflexota bacterium]